LTLNVSSDVLGQVDGSTYVLVQENVSLIATAHLTDNSSYFADNHSHLHFRFQYRNLYREKWILINCSEGNLSATVVYSWNSSGEIECLVQLLTQDDEILACSTMKIYIAGM